MFVGLSAIILISASLVSGVSCTVILENVADTLIEILENGRVSGADESVEKINNQLCANQTIHLLKALANREFWAIKGHCFFIIISLLFCGFDYTKLHCA